VEDHAIEQAQILMEINFVAAEIVRSEEEIV
jgi:hypothetical protein